jgi:hypothetical protein
MENLSLDFSRVRAVSADHIRPQNSDVVDSAGFCWSALCGTGIQISSRNSCQTLPACESDLNKEKSNADNTKSQKSFQNTLIPQKYWDHLYEMAFLAAASVPFDSSVDSDTCSGQKT